ncbi:MAG: HD domain-containing protein [Candidatus Nealsonbacteria bacterium]|nr:HD domain-containing protein [Candidatus Nealsonbacteria bacterium]
MDRCPGQDLRYLNPEDVFIVHCPHCKGEVEFFKDEPTLRCPACKEKVSNPKIDLGCAKWCAFAEECLGVTSEASGVVQSLSERLVAEMESVFGSDQRRIDHAKKVLAFAERILEHEKADPLTVKAAAILHDIAIPEAERKHGSSGGRYQEIEGPPIARPILEKLGIDEQTADHVCRIIGSHHSAKDIDTPEFRILWDADWLVNIPVEHAGASREKLADLIGRVFKTDRGRAIAEQLFLDGGS